MILTASISCREQNGEHVGLLQNILKLAHGINKISCLIFFQLQHVKQSIIPTSDKLAGMAFTAPLLHKGYDGPIEAYKSSTDRHAVE